MVVLICRGKYVCVCTREGQRINLQGEKDKVRDCDSMKEEREREKICAEVILGALLHVVKCIVPFPHARPQCLAEH